MKDPNQPHMGKTLQAPERVGIPVLRLENQKGVQFRRQAALPRDAEFCGENTVHPCNRFEVHGQTSFPCHDTKRQRKRKGGQATEKHPPFRSLT